MLRSGEQPLAWKYVQCSVIVFDKTKIRRRDCVHLKWHYDEIFGLFFYLLQRKFSQYIHRNAMQKNLERCKQIKEVHYLQNVFFQDLVF